MIGLAFAAFVFNTSEFLPVGLLPDMAASLNESVSFMGLVITGYAWVVSIMSLPLALLTARFERKKLLLFLLGLFAICHFAVLWVDSFWSLYATRIGVALAHSIFWSIMNPLAARMAPAGKRATGLAAVMAAPSLQRFWASRSEPKWGTSSDGRNPSLSSAQRPF